MSRYRIKLVPQGIFGADLNIGIRMTPLPPAIPDEVAAPAPTPPPDCVPVCNAVNGSGWMSSAGTATTATGTGALSMLEGPWTVRLDIDGEICSGMITWEYSGDFAQDVDFVVAESGKSVWLFGPRMDGYNGSLTVQAKLDGEDFCDPFVFTFAGVIPDPCWSADPPFTGFYIADIAGFSSHFTWSQLPDPPCGVTGTLSFSVTQTLGTAWTPGTEPYGVDNGDGTCALWLDATDRSLNDTTFNFTIMLDGNPVGGAVYTVLNDGM